jgi:hypothetical protein
MKEDIIAMARRAGAHDDGNEVRFVELRYLERFAALVRADERNRTWTQEHWTEYERSIAAAEREAVEDLLKEYDMVTSAFAKDFRARGQE